MFGTPDIVVKVKWNRLRWVCHIPRFEDDRSVKRVLNRNLGEEEEEGADLGRDRWMKIWGNWVLYNKYGSATDELRIGKGKVVLWKPGSYTRAVAMDDDDDDNLLSYFGSSSLRNNRKWDSKISFSTVASVKAAIYSIPYDGIRQWKMMTQK